MQNVEFALQFILSIGILVIGVNAVRQKRITFQIGSGIGFPIPITERAATLAGGIFILGGVVLTGWNLYLIVDGSNRPDLVNLEWLPFIAILIGTFVMAGFSSAYLTLIERAITASESREQPPPTD